MANYNLVLNTRFKPFSFDELLKVPLMATQYHQSIEKEYADLQEKASIWEHMANSQKDERAYKMYKHYADDLEEKAGALAREGANAASIRSMYNMKSRFNKEILPIEQAFKARANEIKEQLAGRANGMVYEGDASLASLDRYLDDPSIKYRFANSQEGYKRLGAAAEALSKELRGGLRTGKLDAYTNTLLREHGYRPNEIRQAILDIETVLRGGDSPRGNNLLTSLLAQEMNTAGIGDWNKAAQIDYFNRVSPALYRAVGQTGISTYDNYGSRMAAKIAAASAKKDNRQDPEGLNYRRMTGLNVTNAKDTKIAKEDLEFLRKIQANPELLRKETIRKGSVSNVSNMRTSGRRVGVQDNTISTKSIRAYENYERLKAIEQRYNINVTGLGVDRGYGDKFTFYKGYGKELEKAINDRIAKGVITDDIWQANTTDNEWIVKGWLDAGKTAISHFDKVDMWKYENGKRKERLSRDDLDNIDTKDSSYYSYIDKNDNVRIVMTYIDKDGKMKSAEVGDMLVGGPELTTRKNLVKEALKQGRTDMVPALMDDINAIIYGTGNTRAYTQGKTDSKLSPSAPFNYETYSDIIMMD